MAEHQVSLEVFELNLKENAPQVLGVLDLMSEGDLPIAMTFQVKDINNLDENTAAFTKTFDIPATRHNNSVLEKCYSDNLVDYAKFIGDAIKCNIKVNGLTILTGSFQITSTIGTDKITAYTCTVLGDANNWTTQFENPMCETQWDAESSIYDNNTSDGWYTFTSSLWKKLNDNVVDCDDHTWCMPHICWGAYANMQNHPNGSSTRAKMYLEDNVPSIFIKPLIEKYFNELGYTLKSDFFNTSYFKKLLFPLDYAYFRHGYGQEPVFHIEARFMPPNPNDAMWNDTSGNGFANAEMFGMFLLAEVGDIGMKHGSRYANPSSAGGTNVNQPTWLAAGDSNFQNHSAYSLRGGGWYAEDGATYNGGGDVEEVTGATWNYPPIDSDGHPSPFDGAWGLRTYDEGSPNEIQLVGNNPFPFSLGVSFDDSDPDTAQDGTLEGMKIHASCNRIPFNHVIRDNGKGCYDAGGTSKRWASEAVVNFQPPLQNGGGGGGGLDPADWIASGVVLIMPEMCGTYGDGVQFIDKYGDPDCPYLIDPNTPYPRLASGVEGIAMPYHKNSAWYGVYNGWELDIVELFLTQPPFSGSGHWRALKTQSHIGLSQWNKTVTDNPNSTPMITSKIARISGNLKKCQGESGLPSSSSNVYWTNTEGCLAEWRTRQNPNTNFFNWAAPKEGKYRFEILVPAMFGNKEIVAESMRPHIRVLKSAIDNHEVQDVDVVAQRVGNWKPQYDDGWNNMVYHEFKIDTGYITCKKGDRVMVDASIPPSRMKDHMTKNQLIMLSEEFSHRLNSQSATDPFIWDDWCEVSGPYSGSYTTGKIIKESFPMDAATGDYVIPNGYFKCFQDDKVRHMDRFNLRDMLPCDITKMEFISGLTGLWNLHWHTDEIAKIVSVEPFDTFYRGKADAEDWTYKRDYSTEAVTSFMVDRLAKEIKFAYQEDSGDGMVDVVSLRQNQHWHSHEIELNQGFLNDEIILGTSLFAPTYMIEDFELHYGFSGGKAPWIPIIVSDHEDDIGYLSPKPDVSDGFMFRLLSYEGMQSVGMETCYGSWHWNIPHPITGINGDVSTYPQAVSWHPDSATAPNLSYSLSETVTGVQNGLYHDYWRGMMSMLAASPRMKVVSMYLTPSDIAKLDLRNIIHMTEYGGANATYWIVSRVIDYQPHLDEPTQVELIQWQIKTNDKGIVAHNDDTVSTVFNGTNTNHSAARTPRRVVSSGTRNTNNANALMRSSNTGTNHRNKRTIMQVAEGNDAPMNSGIAMFGNNLISRREGQVVLGQFNKQDDNAIFVVGGGTSNDDRKNIISVTRDGQVVFGDEGGGTNMITKDEQGNYVDMFTEIPEKGTGETIVTKVIK